ncbi:MAG: phosphotransferase [Alphaproteobacteria bacterium]|nr:phosphotransferase [Alphaproteobacteria bacterium]
MNATFLNERAPLFHHITALHGDEGQKWLDALPSQIQALSQRWRLHDLAPVSNMTYHCVLTGFKDQRPIVLKIGFAHLMQEITALKAFADKGAPLVYDAIPHAFFMERACPGTSLRALFPYDDMVATDHFCQVYRTLHGTIPPPTGTFPPLDGWLGALSKAYPAIPHSLLEKARVLSQRLLETTKTPTLLHGDLHHDNILEHSNTWMMIDPKGVQGDPLYDIAPFMRNPFPELFLSPSPLAIIERRFEHLTRTLALDPNRLLAWLFVDAILSWIWCLEDHLDAAHACTYAHLIWDKAVHINHIPA